MNSEIDGSYRLDTLAANAYLSRREAEEMSAGWLFLKVGPDTELALPPAAVYRLVHRADPEFSGRLPEAVDMGNFLGCGLDPSLPGVIVALESGASWLVGDAVLQGQGEGLRYHALPGDLFAQLPPWTRGVLVGGERWAYVVEESATGRERA